MRILWNKNHAEVGPFKLNVYRNSRDVDNILWTWMGSTPGFTNWGGHDLVSEEVAKAAAEKFVVEQLLKFLSDLDIQQPIVVRSRLIEDVKCEDCYGTGRWGPNGSQVHQACQGSGRLPKPSVPA